MRETAINNPERPQRRSVRLKCYDYSQPGAYFITICTHDRECIFGDVVDGEMRLNEFGKVVAKCWDDLRDHYPLVATDAFVMMPNHVHGIVVLTDDADNVGAGFEPARKTCMKHVVARRPLSEIVRGFKTFSSRRVNEMRGMRGTPVWQRNYYEHVIRNEKELTEIRHYIINNALKWDVDEENPKHMRQREPT